MRLKLILLQVFTYAIALVLAMVTEENSMASAALSIDSSTKIVKLEHMK